MFPVTLEAADGRLQTYSTACYGFLRDYEWCDYDESFCNGWNRLVQYPYMPANAAEPFGRNCIYHYGNTAYSTDARIDLEELSAIWNSGAVLPFIGLSKSGSAHIAYQVYNQRATYGSEERDEAVDNIARWCSVTGVEYSRKKFLLDLESYIDAGRESALLFDDRGFTGVRADIPADRAMFYLMVDRELWSRTDYDRTKFIMEQIHDKGRNPMIAFLVSRLVSKMSNAFGRDDYYYCGNSGDNCILPDALIAKGLGKLYSEPSAIDWFQQPYTSGNGHMRDDDIEEDYGHWNFSSDEFSRYCSPSLFNSVFKLENKGDSNPVTLLGCEEPATPVKVLIAKAAIPQSEYNNRNHRLWDLGDWLEDVSGSNDLQISNDDFEDLAFNLLMGNE